MMFMISSCDSTPDPAPNKIATIIINNKDTLTVEYYNDLHLSGDAGYIYDANSSLKAINVNQFSIINTKPIK